MNLSDVIRNMGALLMNRVSHAEAVRTLYGVESPRASPDARRLAIYATSFEHNSREILEMTYPLCRQSVERLRGEKEWCALSRDYFAAHPQRHFRFGRGADEFPAFLRVARHDLPTWLWELADFELWERLTLEAPDTPEDLATDGQIRLASSVELRDYTHDLTGWVDSEEGRGEPALISNVVLFWRDRARLMHREPIGEIEFQVLRAVRSGLSPANAEISATEGERQDAVNYLHEMGILLGDLGAADDSAG
jgi:hypothetical protein